MPRVFAIILNYKKWMEARECLETLLLSRSDNFTAVVIDNNSQNNSIEELIDWVESNTALKESSQPSYKYYKAGELNNGLDVFSLPRLVFIQNETNKGFAGGINTFLTHLLNKDAYAWLLNPDMTVDPSALTELLNFAVSSPAHSIIGSVIKFYDDPGKVHLYAGGKINFNSATVELLTNKNDIDQLDYISGGSFFTHAGNFLSLGLLPEDYFLYWEETDFCYRAKQQGFQLLLCDTAVCYDKISTSIGKSFLSDYYYTRNGLLFLSKYKKEKVSTAIFFTILRILKRLVSGKMDRAKGMYKGMMSFIKRDKHEDK